MNVPLESSLEMPLAELLPVIQKRITQRSTYFGIPTLKSPLDFWIYQEILYDTQPDVLIEIGNHHGGALLAYAHLMDAMGKGRIIGVDTDQHHIPKAVRAHQRISLVEGDAVESFELLRKQISRTERVLVIEDSSHTYENTLQVLRTYSALLHPDDYFIVEDGICHHGLEVGPNPGPYEAIEAFVLQDKRFEIDREREGFLLTWNPKGYLRRKNLSGGDDA